MGFFGIKGLFEAHLTVRDLDRSIAFYRDIVGLKLAHRIDDRHAAFLWIGKPGQGMVGLWSHYSSPVSMRLHLAFSTKLTEVVASIERLHCAGVVPRDNTGEVAREPMVIAWMLAASVYFDDPDGHSLEFIAMLDEKPRSGLAFVPLSRWRETAG